MPFNGSLHDSSSSDDPISWVLVLVIYSPLYAVGLFGNSLLIYIIAHDRKLWTNVNFYILNLSVANLLECLIVVLSPSLQIHPLCALAEGVQNFSACVAVYSLVAITLEAYNKVTHPVWNDSDINGVLGLFVAIWTFAAAFCFGNQLLFGGVTCRTVIVQYGLHPPLFEFIILYLAPLVCILLCYAFIVRELYFLTNKDAQQLEQFREIWKKLSTVVVVLVVSYFTSFSPYYCVRLLTYFQVIRKYNTILCILYTLTNLHFCMNPIILYSFSKPCRDQFNKYLSLLVRFPHSPLGHSGKMETTAELEQASI